MSQASFGVVIVDAGIVGLTVALGLISRLPAARIAMRVKEDTVILHAAKAIHLRYCN